MGAGITWSYRLRINMPRQEQDFWCWAAVSAAVSLRLRGQVVQQCDVANAVLSMNSCCVAPNACNKAYSLPPGLRWIKCFRGQVNRPLTFAEIEGELKNGLPVGVRYEWSAKTAHFCLIDGTSIAKDVSFSDSFYRPSIRPFLGLSNNYVGKRATWTHSYLLQHYTDLGGKALPIERTASTGQAPSFASEGFDDTIGGMKLQRFVGNAEELAAGGGLSPEPAGYETFPEDGDSGAVEVISPDGVRSLEFVENLREIRDAVMLYRNQGARVCLLEIPEVFISALWLERNGEEWIIPIKPSTNRVQIGRRYERRSFELEFRPYASQVLEEGKIEHRLTYGQSFDMGM